MPILDKLEKQEEGRNKMFEVGQSLPQYESVVLLHKQEVLLGLNEDTFSSSNYLKLWRTADLYQNSLLEEKFDSKEPVSSLIAKYDKYVEEDVESESFTKEFKSMSLWKWMHRLLGSNLVNLREVVFIGVTELNCKAQKILMHVISMESSLERIAVSAEFFKFKKDLCMFGTVLSKFEGESVEVSFYHEEDNGELGVFSSALHCSKRIPRVLMIELGNIYAVDWKFKRYLEESERENVKILGSLTLCHGSSLTLNSVIILDDLEKVFEIFDSPRLFPTIDE